jgi:hypothetical protein
LRSIMIFARFLRLFCLSLLLSPAKFAGLPYFNLDIHRADAAD